MHEIYELKEMLCKELEEYGGKELTAGSLDVIDKLAHAIKNLDKIIEKDEESEYSGDYPDMSMRGPYYGDGSYRGNDGGSYARGRNAKRDSRGRYSSARGYSRAKEDTIDQLRSVMEDLPESVKMDAKRLISKMENM